MRNPTLKTITLQATVNGRDLSGPLSIELQPGEKDVYSLTFAPAQVGKSRGRSVVDMVVLVVVSVAVVLQY